jgi:hypothetical protein
VTRLGEDIAGLDLRRGRAGVDDATRRDYVHALDSYDRAKQTLETAARPSSSSR